MLSNGAQLVSVIVPCYQQGEFLAQAVDSCLEQTYAYVETIVVNDGSIDSTDKVARSYGSRIVYIKKENRGLSAARNTGIAAASGRYLKFLDADDHLHPEQIERQVTAIGDRDNCVSFTALRNYAHGKPDDGWDYLPKFKNLLPDVFSDHDGCAPHSMLVPATLARTIGGFREDIRFCEDWDFILRLGLLDPLVVVDARVGGYYRRRPNSMSTNRVGMVSTAARNLVDAHRRFQLEGKHKWLGRELLCMEQRTYRNFLTLENGHPELLSQLLNCIRELQALYGYAEVEGRSRYLAPFLGYSRMEKWRASILRWMGRLPNSVSF
jgi:glycosyltransferase involved in cell wall biosynthesis